MANDQQVLGSSEAHENISDFDDKSDDKTVTPPNENNDNNEKVRADGKRELTEDDAYEILAYNWPTWKKWMYLCSVAIIQIAMNYNTSVYPNAVTPLVEEFGITEQKARTGQMIYLLFYSFGCELWAPWSEEFGRWPILQLSESLINIFILPAALANNFGSILASRALVCGLPSTRAIQSLICASVWSFHRRWQCYTRFDCRSLRARGPTVPSRLHRLVLLHWHKYWWCHWWPH